MESQRSLFAIGLLFVSFLLWTEWQKDYGPQPVQQTNVSEIAESATATRTNEDVPTSNISQSTASTPVQGSNSQLLTVKTDTLNVEINTQGGDVVLAQLLKYPLEQNSPEPITILDKKNSTLHVAQSGLIGTNGPDGRPAGRPIYTTDQTSFELQTGQDELRVPLHWADGNGLTITKEFVFIRDSHSVLVEYTVENNTSGTVSFQQYAQLKQTMAVPESNMFMPTYRGAAYSTSEERYEKYTFDNIVDENLKETTKAGWVSMIQHYFVAAWVPPQDQTNFIFSKSTNNTFAIIGYTGEVTNVAAGQTGKVSSHLYVGPKDQDKLADLAENLDLTVDYGFLWWLAQPLFWLLSAIQTYVFSNWGATIIAITIIVKGFMYPLTKAQYESMAKLRALQPKMQALKDRFGEDRQKMSQAMMELYRKEKVNPMGGCFPLILQMPIFLALYWVLLESVELRHASFVFWITDLSVKDPFFVLPVLTGASMYLLQKLQPMTMQDPMQQKIMQLMPVFMSIFFLWFPAGLVLYWLISNIITLVQAKMIYSAMDKKGLKAR